MMISSKYTGVDALFLLEPVIEDGLESCAKNSHTTSLGFQRHSATHYEKDRQ
jgi:hypothetical protein